MRIIQDSPNVLLVSDDEQIKLPWSVAVFEKTRFSSVDDPFREINSYWASIPESRRSVIWGLYQKIWNVFQDVQEGYLRMSQSIAGSDTEYLVTHITPLVTELYNQMPMHEIDKWLVEHGGIKYPDNLKTTLDADDICPDKTYLKDDYHGLVVLTTALRPMVPIWGAFVNQIKKEAGTSYKEYRALPLIAKTHLITSQPMTRLQRYIDASIATDVDSAAAVVDGLSTAEIPDWLLSLVIVRRMALGEVDAIEERGSIISNIYGFVFHTLKELDKKFGGVKEKYPNSDKEDGEDGSSKLEFFKVKEPLTAGEQQTFVVYTENPVVVAHHVDPSCPTELVLQCVDAALQSPREMIEPVRIRLAQMILASQISPGAIHGKNTSMSRHELLRILGISQALLFHWRFDLLAVLIMSCRHDADDGYVTNSQGRSKILPATIEKLNEVFPYAFSEGGSRRSNIGVSEIQKMVIEFNSQSWLPTTPVELWDNGRVKLNAIACVELQSSHDQLTLGEMLARLAIHIDSEG